MHKNGFDGLQEGLRNLHVTKPPQQKPPTVREGSKIKMAKTPVMDSYYAVNAPAPGTVGVASARINKSYTESQDAGYHHTSVPVSHSQYYANTQPQHMNSPHLSKHIYTDENTMMAHSPKPRGERALYANVNPLSPPSHYASYGYDEEFPYPPSEDVVFSPRSPPSPVSSSYSELRHTHSSQRIPYCLHATQGVASGGIMQHLPGGANPPVGATYAPLSQTSSTYESIYEPLTPRPTSQMSEVSGYHGPYTSPLAKGLVPAPSNQPLINPDKVGKEAEVDALTNLLVQSMDSSGDPEFFGICARCNEKVVGEGSGCTAMDQVFHIQCFCCVVCLLKLQGKPFYALDSKPYCEDCYLNTLEKCCVCTKPILDRILRATGKPYHPQCFTCVVCHKSLDGIPFTVDASNQIHCIDDFHKKFAPRCSVCGEPIMPETGQDETVRVVALDRSFHVGCYKCEDCGLVLSSEAEGKGCYPLDNHVLCKSCNARRVQALTSKVTTEL